MQLKKLASMAAALLIGSAVSASAVTLIDNSTMGLYNDGIGGALNGSSAFFPDAGTAIDPVASLAAAPDLSSASAELGAWLTNPTAPGGSWGLAAVSIPLTWAVETETAIIYAIDAGPTGMTNVEASFGVDNGIVVWLNGGFIGGDQAPGGASANEYTYALGSLAAGTHYLQVLREDHGGGTGYSISVTGDAALSAVPLPASGLLLLGGLAGMIGAMRRRR